MLAVARATAVLCALIGHAWAHRSGAPNSFTASEPGVAAGRSARRVPTTACPMPHFDLALIQHGQYHDWLISGLLVSLELAGLTLACALPLAVVIALLRMAPAVVLRGLGAFYVEGI